MPSALSVQRLRQMATGGTASIAAGVAATNILRIVSSMTLTRLLDAHAYGVVGVIVSIAYMLTMLADAGLYGFIVRHKEGDDPTFLDQIWTLRLVRGAGLTLLMVVLAKPVAMLLGKPELAPVIAIWGFSFLLEGFSSLAWATAVRGRQLWRLSLLDLSNNLTTFIVSIALALVLHSYWALVIGMIGGAAMKMAVSYILFPQTRRRWHFNRDRSAELWQFSRYIAASSILSLLILQSDKLVLARLMPLSEYGLYAIAVTLAAAPASLANPYNLRVLFSTYSKTYRDAPETLARVFYQARRKVALAYAFVVGGMIGAAPLIIAILYDPRYHNVTPFLQLISISALLRMGTLSANQAMLAVGRTRATLLVNIYRVVWLAIGGAVGLITHNIMLLVAIVGTVEVPGTLVYWWYLHREKLLDLRQESYSLIVGAAGAGLGWALATLLLGLFPTL